MQKPLDQLKDHSKESLMAWGRSLRRKSPRSGHKGIKAITEWKTDISGALIQNRISKLLPLYIERVGESPFAFFRGAAAIMAEELSRIPSTGIIVQACGDCHLLNFGGFATPERNIIFDINDFDETSEAPWEWDLKRLAASIAIAGKSHGLSKKEVNHAVQNVARSYQLHTWQFADMSTLEVWYSSIDYEELIHSSGDPDVKRFRLKRLEKAMERTPHEKEFREMTEVRDGQVRIKDTPPLIYHFEGRRQDLFLEQVTKAYKRYFDQLPDDRKILLKQYKLQDAAMKIVGVGSVGTWCGIVLLVSESGDAIFLQFKEANPSVLEAYAGESQYDNHAQRVVEGQRLMQSASDIFLGWTTNDAGQDFYVRQLRDAKIKPALELMDAKSFSAYAAMCGRALSQAHARSGTAAAIAGYMGRSSKFVRAIADFAKAYEKYNKQNFVHFMKSVETQK